MTIEEWLGKDNTLGIDIWKSKYQYNGEGFEDWLERISGGDHEVKELIRQKKFLFGGRILANRGLEHERKITLSNCLTPDTKILTKDGIKTLGELAGKSVKVLSCGSWRDGEVKSFGVQDYVNLSIHKGKQTKVFHVTPDHIWFARSNNKEKFQEIQTKDLLPGMELASDYLNGEKPEDERNWIVDDVSDVVGKSEVFCAVVPETHSFCLDGNILTHNCYVTSTGDSIEDIFDTAKKIARTFSYGGGIGVDISPLAPRGATVHNAAKTSTGAVSFMDLYSLVTGLIGQSGRRGALMISMACDHPDIEEFIDVKNDLDRVNFANISVRVTNKFMEAVENDEDFTLYFKREETGEEITRTIRARELFHKLAENNWRTGEPGVLFWDRISSYNLLDTTPGFSYAGTNPCGEEPLPNGGSCLLGSMNLSEFVENPFRDDAQFDFDGFGQAVNTCIFALNKVLDEGADLHPLEEQRECVRKWRQIGLGYMGIADAMLKLGIRYGSRESLAFITEVGKTMARHAIGTSALLGADWQKSFEGFDMDAVRSSSFYRAVSVFDPEFDEHFQKMNAMLNSQLMTVAPTGTLSTMLGISGGIEPIFANYYTRTTKSIHDQDVTYKVYTPIVKEYMEANGITDDADLPDYFVTAQNIPYEERIAVQAAMQEYIDASISSTVNLPNSATVEDIENLYLLAWKMGCKGITVFRDGCERAGILNAGPSEEKKTAELQRGFVKKVGNDAVGLERHLTTGCGSLHCSAFFDRETGELLETYLSKGSEGGCLSSLTGLSRMISLAARGGIDVDRIVDQLKSSVTCPSYAVRRAMQRDTSTGNCCPAAVGNALLDMHREFLDKFVRKDREEDAVSQPSLPDKAPDEPKVKRLEETGEDGFCPLCGEKLVFEGGCATCRACGWSRCG